MLFRARSSGAPGDDTRRRYSAFISYAREDKSFAAWLHSRLERYRIPTGVRSKIPSKYRAFEKSLFPVCRDTEEFKGGDNLPATIKSALSNAACLIVIATKHGAASTWVRLEIEEFVRTGNRSRIVIVDPSEEGPICVPPALATDEAVMLGDQRVAGAPLVPRFGLTRRGRNAALLRTIAFVLEVGFDDLAQRDLARMRTTYRIAALLGVAAVIAVYWTMQRFEARESERLAAQSHALTAEADQQVDSGQYAQAIDNLLSALPASVNYDDRPILPRAEALLAHSLYHATQLAEVSVPEPVQSLVVTDNGVLTALLEGSDSYYIDVGARTANRVNANATEELESLRGPDGSETRFRFKSAFPGYELLIKDRPDSAPRPLGTGSVGPVAVAEQEGQLVALETEYSGDGSCNEPFVRLTERSCVLSKRIVRRSLTNGNLISSQDVQAAHSDFLCGTGQFLVQKQETQGGENATSIVSARAIVARVGQWNATIFKFENERYDEFKKLIAIRDAACSSDQDSVLVLTSNGTLRRISLETAQGTHTMHQLPEQWYVDRDVSIDHDGDGLVVLNAKHPLSGRLAETIVFPAQSSARPWRVEGANSYAVAPRGGYVAVVSESGILNVRNRSGRRHQLRIAEGQIHRSEVRFSEDGLVLAVSYLPRNDDTVRIVVTRPFEEEVSVAFAAPATENLAAPILELSPEGRLVAIAGSDTILVHATRRHGMNGEVTSSDDLVLDHRLLADGRLIATNEHGFHVFDGREEVQLFMQKLRLTGARGGGKIYSPTPGLAVVNHDDGVTAFDLDRHSIRWQAPGLHVQSHQATKSALLVGGFDSNSPDRRFDIIGMSKGESRCGDKGMEPSSGCSVAPGDDAFYCYKDSRLSRVSENSCTLLQQIELASEICGAYPLAGGKGVAVFVKVSARQLRSPNSRLSGPNKPATAHLDTSRCAYGGTDRLEPASVATCAMQWLDATLKTVPEINLRPRIQEHEFVGTHGTWRTNEIRVSADGNHLIGCRSGTCRVWISAHDRYDYALPSGSGEVKWADASTTGGGAPTLYVLTSERFVKINHTEPGAGWSLPVRDPAVATEIELLHEKRLALVHRGGEIQTLVLVELETGLPLWYRRDPLGITGHLGPNGTSITFSDGVGSLHIVPTLPTRGRQLIEEAASRRCYRVSLGEL